MEMSLFGLAQCWEFVNGSACEDCLANAVSNIRSCTPKEDLGVELWLLFEAFNRSSIIIRLSLLETVIKVSLVPMNFFTFCCVFPSSDQMGY